jgi:hypothetical protein
LTGETFGGAHDALNDCRATLRVFRAMLDRGNTIEAMQRWTTLPLPGDADFAGKLRWIGDQIIITFGEHAGTDLADVRSDYLRWMLTKDFPDDTKALVTRVLAGDYPTRDYESEAP